MSTAFLSVSSRPAARVCIPALRGALVCLTMLTVSVRVKAHPPKAAEEGSESTAAELTIYPSRYFPQLGFAEAASEGHVRREIFDKRYWVEIFSQE